MVEVTVRSRIPGGAWEVERTGVRITVDSPTTVRQLIADVVAAQIGAQSESDSADDAWRRAARLYLTDAEVRAMAAQGVVRLTAPPTRLPAPDVAAEQRRAVAAFRQGVFVVFAAGRQFTELDESVTLDDGDRPVFLRLTPLAGG
jgi:hypothetical protein